MRAEIPEDSAPGRQRPAPAVVPPAAAPARAPRSRWRLAVIITAFVGVFGLTEYLAAVLLASNPLSVRIPLSILAMVGVAVGLAVCGAVVRVLHHWARPVRRLRRSLEEIDSGALPIEQLARDLHGLSELAPILEKLLRDRRQQRAEITRLNAEMRVRVQQRTDALERTIGSLRAQATRDALTGLFNRRMLDQCLDEVVGKCHAEQVPLTLLMIDVDDFKLLNDTLGHAAGDELLKCIGQLIRSSIRGDDLAFRCGGDEFMVLMPGAGEHNGESLARRLTELVDALAKPLAVARRPRLCVGIASLLATGATTGKELAAHADERLYALKASRKSARTTRVA